jgi:5-methyltetrahydropteroyltriglutamate--homocysteine methyltransferase
MDFIYQLDGITKEPGEIKVKFHNEQGDIEFTPAALHVDGKLGVSKTIFGDDFRFVRETVTRNVPKLTIPSPSMVHYRGGKAAIDPRVYPISTRSGPTSSPRTARRCAASASSAARTCSSTTRASPT